jgi:nucleoside-diphosphate-sugar epimerase
MALPRLIVTGASGFIGRRILDGLKERFQIVGMARRSQLRSGAPFHENISWFQVDIGDRESVGTAFQFVRDSGGADYVVHLAAHYDFTGEDHPEYQRTNVDGLRHVLDECRDLDLKRFLFASSVAACQFPPKGTSLTEASPPDGEHIYAVTKRMGEEMLAEYDDDVPSCIIRFAAMFSDWCEYAPLYIFTETWLAKAWNSTILGGKGRSAIPYLHIREIPLFFWRLIESEPELAQREVVICSGNQTVDHKELFGLVTKGFYGRAIKPLCMPSPLARVGVWGRDLLGRILGNRPFERPWMVKYIDWDLAVDASRTHQMLGWNPRERLLIQRRIPFMLENLKTDPVEWHRRNQAALKDVHLRSNLRIHRLLEKYHDLIRSRFIESLIGPDSAVPFPNYQGVSKEVLEWRFTVVLRHLLSAIRTGEKGLFTAYCRDLARKRFAEGFEGEEICRALESLNEECLAVLRADPEAAGLDEALRDHLTMTVQFGCDQVMEIYDELGGDFAI